MAVTITADVQTAYPPRVLVSVLGLTLGDSIELFRVVGGERTPVRAGVSADLADTSFLRVDAELPFGVPVSYLAIVNGSDEYATSSTTYTLTGGKVAITDAISGTAVEIVIVAWGDKAWDKQATVFKVGGRNVVVSGELGMFEGDVQVSTADTATRDLLLAALAGATEGIVQIRQPGGYDGIDSYLAVTSASEARVSHKGTDPRRIFTLRVAEVEPWATALEAQGYTLQDIADVYDGLTLDDLSDDFATLLDIAQAEFTT